MKEMSQKFRGLGGEAYIDADDAAKRTKSP
jgi:hypothetical protein